jgi:RNA polymerase sigma-70 factor, ECF subfamily
MPEPPSSGHPLAGHEPSLGPSEDGAESDSMPAWSASQADRLRRLFDQQFAFVWRYLRRLGLSPSDADDAAQKVFVVLARRLLGVTPGKERAFLCATAARVVSEHRRTIARRHEVASPELEVPPDSKVGPESLVDRRRARLLLDQVLDELPDELRSVFVLFELEELETGEIAALLALPEGTVASRLRRAREKFRGAVRRLQASGRIPGGSA